jgi:hypothetical protein
LPTFGWRGEQRGPAHHADTVAPAVESTGGDMANKKDKGKKGKGKKKDAEKKKKGKKGKKK